MGLPIQRTYSEQDILNAIFNATQGAISVINQSNSSTVQEGNNALPVKRVALTASTSGDTNLVAAVVGKKIRVLNVILMANGTVNVKFRTADTDITGLLYLVANTGFAPGYNNTGHFETGVGEPLDINLSGAVAVGGWLSYIEV